MASYVNLTLDTIGPSGVSVKINGDEESTTSTSVMLSIACADADLTGYQMKIWGTASAPTEDTASWETFQETKNITLPTQDGIKTVHVRVRDDVWNESVTASDTITLFTRLPSVTGLSLSKAKVSLVSGMNTTGGGFNFDENIDAAKIMIVQDINARHDDPSNVSVPTTNGSYIVAEDENKLSDGYMEFNNKPCDCIFAVYYDINAADIAAVAPGDGIKIIKVFVRSATSGNWSV